MANRRMFSLDVVDTDWFLDMPASAQSLYFHLGMRADDDGFVSSPKRITAMANCSQDDLKLLIAKKFIIPFESGVVVITDWKRNNYIQKDRYTPTQYVEERDSLTLERGVYRLDTKCIQNVSEMETQVRLGKDSTGKNKGDINISSCTEPETVSMPEPAFISLPLNDGSLWPVTFSYLEQLKGLYPALDVEQEIRKMFAWIDSKPSNRKTKRGIKSFITNWLSRAQDRARTVTPAANTGYKTKKQRVDDELVDFVNAMGGM